MDQTPLKNQESRIPRFVLNLIEFNKGFIGARTTSKTSNPRLQDSHMNIFNPGFPY